MIETEIARTLSYLSLLNHTTYQLNISYILSLSLSYLNVSLWFFFFFCLFIDHYCFIQVIYKTNSQKQIMSQV